MKIPRIKKIIFNGVTRTRNDRVLKAADAPDRALLNIKRQTGRKAVRVDFAER